MTKINVGILGFGLAGAVFHAPVIQSCKQFDLKSIASRGFDGKVIPEGVSATGIRDVISDPNIDLVVIATPNSSHFSLAFEALSAGKHVVVDKPFVIRVAEAETLMALSMKEKKVLSVYQNRRYDGGFRTARTVVEGGALGRISYAEFHYDRFNPEVRRRWREEASLGAGVLYDLGPHLIDQAYCLFGMPKSVFADVAIQRQGAIVDDYFHVILDYGTMRVVLHATSLAHNIGPRILLHGDKASFEHYGLDTQEADLKAGKRPGDEGWGNMDTAQGLLTLVDGTRKTINSMNGCYEKFYEGIAESILNQAIPPVEVSDARNTLAILDAAVKSGVERRTVALV